jgi:hypothetical protein
VSSKCVAFDIGFWVLFSLEIWSFEELVW